MYIHFHLEMFNHNEIYHISKGEYKFYSNFHEKRKSPFLLTDVKFNRTLLKFEDLEKTNEHLILYSFHSSP